MIQFIYRPNPDAMKAIQDNMDGYTNDFVYGYMEEGVVNQLHHRALFLACKNHYTEKSGAPIMSAPIVIVAKNETEAITLYGEIMDCDDVTVFAKLEDKCNGLEVEIV